MPVGPDHPASIGDLPANIDQACLVLTMPVVGQKCLAWNDLDRLTEFIT